MKDFCIVVTTWILSCLLLYVVDGHGLNVGESVKVVLFILTFLGCVGISMNVALKHDLTRAFGGWLG